MRQRSTHALGLLALAALVLGVALGCGGGTKKTAATTPATTKAAATQPSSTTSALSGLATAANCKELADLAAKFSEAAGGTNSQDTKKIAALLEDFASKTPSDIRPDFKILADAFSKIADAVGGLKPGATPDALTLAKLAKLAGEIDTAKLTAASANIQAWTQKNCRP